MPVNGKICDWKTTNHRITRHLETETKIALISFSLSNFFFDVCQFLCITFLVYLNSTLDDRQPIQKYWSKCYDNKPSIFWQWSKVAKTYQASKWLSLWLLVQSKIYIERILSLIWQKTKTKNRKEQHAPLIFFFFLHWALVVRCCSFLHLQFVSFPFYPILHGIDVFVNFFLVVSWQGTEK